MNSKNPIATLINTKLNQSATRKDGWELLFTNLPNLPNDVLTKHINLWMSKLIQELENVHNDVYNLNGICKTTSALIIVAKEIPEVNKVISMQYIKQMTNIIVNLESCRQCGGTLYLLATMLHYYPEASGKSQGIIETMILSLIDSDNPTMVTNVAKCYTLLSRIHRNFKPPSNNPNYTKYMYNQYLICNTLHSIMDELYPEISSGTHDDALNLPSLSQDDVLLYFQSLERRISNLCELLSTMLKTRIQKSSVSVSDILLLLCRYFELALHNKNEQSARMTHVVNMFLKLHGSFLSVLNGLIIGFGPDLLPEALPILQLIHQTFIWIKNKIKQQELTSIDLKTMTNMRIAAYKSLSTWLKYCGSASSIEWIADKYLPFLLSDIVPEKKSIVLNVQNTQHMTKKALKKFKIRQQKLKQDSENNETEGIDFETNCKLCIEALIALQKILSKGNYLLKSQFYEQVETAVIPILYYIYTGSEQKSCYKLNARCRIELLRTLKSILITPHPLKPLPLANSVEIFQLARIDHCQEIAEEADLVLNILEKICHPTAPSFFLPLPMNSSNSLKRNIDSLSEETVDSSRQKHKKTELVEMSDDEKSEESEDKNEDMTPDNEETEILNPLISDMNCSQKFVEIAEKISKEYDNQNDDKNGEKSNKILTQHDFKENNECNLVMETDSHENDDKSNDKNYEKTNEIFTQYNSEKKNECIEMETDSDENNENKAVDIGSHVRKDTKNEMLKPKAIENTAASDNQESGSQKSNDESNYYLTTKNLQMLSSSDESNRDNETGRDLKLDNSDDEAQVQKMLELFYSIDTSN